jgi:hypothetical protein
MISIAPQAEQVDDAVPALACCVIPSPLRPSALLTVGLPGHLGPDLNGIATFRRYKTRSGWASPLSRGGGVLPTGRASPVGACRFPAASPSPSLPQPVGEGSSDETSTEIHTINPSDLSLARGPRTEREPFGVSLGLRTPPLPATHAKAGTGLTDTDPELHLRHSRTSQRQAHSLPATSRRTAPFTPGQRCSHSRRKRISCRCRSSATSPALRSFSCLPELRVTKPHQGFTLVHPSTLPLACDPRTRQGFLGFPLGFAPHSYP